MKYDVLWLQRGVKAHDLGSMNSTNVANSAECIVSEHRLDTVPSSSLLIGMVIILGIMKVSSQGNQGHLRLQSLD
jgi:hypothetical protein